MGGCDLVNMESTLFRRLTGWSFGLNFDEHGALTGLPHPSPEDIAQFVQTWQLNADSQRMLSNLEPGFCYLVFRDFKPPRDARKSSYDSRLTRFVDKALEQLNRVRRNACTKSPASCHFGGRAAGSDARSSGAWSR